jgi:lactate dehydrogenase-like 2-hydroxyacid dehydrogenase
MQTSVRPVVLVTRKLPQAVEDRLRRDYQARLNPNDLLYSRDELIEHAKGAQAIMACHTEHLSADVIRQLPAEVKIIANFSVGFDHVDIEAAREKVLSSPTPRMCCRTPPLS